MTLSDNSHTGYGSPRGAAWLGGVFGAAYAAAALILLAA